MIPRVRVLNKFGLSLAGLREKAGLTQSQMAEKMKGQLSFSAAGVSRIESGERDVSQEEMSAYLDALEIEEARQFREFFDQDWQFLDRPAFNHVDRELLWKAEEALKAIHATYSNPELKSAFRKQIEQYEEQLRRLAALLETRDHRFALVGSIGVGKSTAICRITGLETVFDQDPPEPVLEVGGGGITVCEVHITNGPGYGLIVESKSDDEIKADVADLCDYLIGQTKSEHADSLSDSDALAISKETIRAIRNLSKLTITKSKDSDGRVIRHDRAKELAQRIGDRKGLLVQILSQMELPRRDGRDVWYQRESGKSPLVWLRDTFAAINNGRHPEFSLPRRIEVVVPTRILLDQRRKQVEERGQFNIRIIDTKGVDQTAGRADLECHFDDPHTSIVLCTRFNDAPETSAQQLLLRARAAGVPNICDRASIVVLPRPEEAIAMKHDDGEAVDSDDEGYDLKREQIEMRLNQIGVDDVPIEFFNARKDDPAKLRGFLLARIEDLRGCYRRQLNELTRTVYKVLENHDKEQYQAVLKSAAQTLRVWLNENRNIEDEAVIAHASLIQAIEDSHASAVQASVRREGAWPNLNYSHHLGVGARQIAADCIGKKTADLKVIAANLINNPELLEAKGFVGQIVQLLEVATESLLRKVQVAGSSAFSEDLKSATELWTTCENEWGNGPGYRNRVKQYNEKWFSNSSLAERHLLIKHIILTGWNEIVSQVDEILGEADSIG